jgi:hypothetical protein
VQQVAPFLIRLVVTGPRPWWGVYVRHDAYDLRSIGIAPSLPEAFGIVQRYIQRAKVPHA